jgi:hypothetical protein
MRDEKRRMKERNPMCRASGLLIREYWKGLPRMRRGRERGIEYRGECGDRMER